MVELRDQNDEPDVLALVRAAGGYVRPSEELRPKLLESARAESRERTARHRIWQAGLAIALLGALLLATAGRWNVPASYSDGMLRPQAGLRPSEARPAEGGPAGWSIVDAFIDLRRRQAVLFNFGP
jgi:hypothetical protein